MIVIGIETSCDETAVSICEDGNILSNIIGSQLVHSEFGGVVPEIASREHEKLLYNLTEEAINSAKIKITDIEGVAVTNGPGLSGALLTGVSFAKGLAIGLGVKIVSINHLEAHIIANFLEANNLSYPFLCFWFLVGTLNYGGLKRWKITHCLEKVGMMQLAKLLTRVRDF